MCICIPKWPDHVKAGSGWGEYIEKHRSSYGPKTWGNIILVLPFAFSSNYFLTALIPFPDLYPNSLRTLTNTWNMSNVLLQYSHFFNLPEKTHKLWVRMEDVFSYILNKLSDFTLKFTLTPSILWKPTITLAWTIEERRKKYRVSQKRWLLAALSSACENLSLNFASWWSRRAAETWWGSQASAPLPFHVLASSSHRQRTSS